MPEKRHFLMNLMHVNNKKSPLIINLSLGYPAGPRNNCMFIKITGFFLKTRFLNIPSQLKFGPKKKAEKMTFLMNFVYGNGQN